MTSLLLERLLQETQFLWHTTLRSNPRKWTDRHLAFPRSCEQVESLNWFAQCLLLGPFANRKQVPLPRIAMSNSWLAAMRFKKADSRNGAAKPGTLQRVKANLGKVFKSPRKTKIVVQGGTSSTVASRSLKVSERLPSLNTDARGAASRLSIPKSDTGEGPFAGPATRSSMPPELVKDHLRPDMKYDDYMGTRDFTERDSFDSMKGVTSSVRRAVTPQSRHSTTSFTGQPLDTMGGVGAWGGRS